MTEIEIPPYFICPISLEIMKDPVTLPTGITYDRESIEQWIFTRADPACPVTNLPIGPASEPLIPNITLRRLIHSWCTLHASDGIQQAPTPKDPITKIELSKIIDQARKKGVGTKAQIECLQTLRSISSQNQSNKRCMESAGAHEFLSSVIIENAPRASDAEISEDLSDSRKACDEALTILYGLQLSESGLKALGQPKLVESLTLVMQFGSYEPRVYGIMLLRSILEVADSALLINLRPEMFSKLCQTLDNQISQKMTKEILKTLIIVCPLSRNRIKAVEAGLVPVLIELLLDSFEKRVCEMVLTVLDVLCQCAEGRAGLLGHGAGLAVVSKKILRVSGTASEKGMKILQLIGRSCGGPRVLHEMMKVGVVAKLCVVVQADCGPKVKERAREILKLHSRAWRDSPCLPRALVSSYPSS